MGNITSYEVTLRAPPDDWREPTRRVLREADELGFRPLRAPDRRVRVYGDGDCVELTVLVDVVAHLAARGGLVTLEGDDGQLDVQIEPSRLRVSLSSTHTLRPERDRRISRRLQALFVATCGALDVVHGYASDEWSWEALFPTWPELEHARARFDEAVAAREPPPVLFATSYFACDYFARVERALADLEARIVRVGGGVLVQRGEPWRVGPVVYADGRYRPGR